MPAQPPFLMPMRSPAPATPFSAVKALMRSAARSVRLITWGFGLAVLMKLVSKILKDRRCTVGASHATPI
jgi:hypothetical protein